MNILNIPKLIKSFQGYDVMKMFQTGDDFYAAMGLRRVPDSFWDLSMLKKPEDGREVICHAAAWDFYDGKVSMDMNT